MSVIRLTQGCITFRFWTPIYSPVGRNCVTSSSLRITRVNLHRFRGLFVILGLLEIKFVDISSKKSKIVRVAAADFKGFFYNFENYERVKLLTNIVVKHPFNDSEVIAKIMLVVSVLVLYDGVFFDIYYVAVTTAAKPPRSK